MGANKIRKIITQTIKFLLDIMYTYHMYTKIFYISRLLFRKYKKKIIDKNNNNKK